MRRCSGRPSRCWIHRGKSGEYPLCEGLVVCGASWHAVVPKGGPRLFRACWGFEMLSCFFDLQGTQTSGSRHRGIGRYTRHLCRSLYEAAGEDKLILGWNSGLESPLPALQFPGAWEGSAALPYGNVSPPRYTYALDGIERELNDRLFRQGLALSRCRHVLFSSLMEMEDNSFMLPNTLNFEPVRSYAVVYDIIPYLFQAHYLPTPERRRRYMAHLKVKLGADVLFSISERTRKDLIDVFGITPQRIVTIGTGIDPDVHAMPSPEEEFRRRFGLDRAFLLFMGGDEYRKNLDGFIAAFAGLQNRDDVQALVLGKIAEGARDACVKRMRGLGLREDAVRFVPFIEENDLARAYKSCALVVVPSVYEGFGLPVLEAMVHDAPIVASAGTSMAEILTNPQFLFDPLSPADMAQKIAFAMSHSDAVKALRASYGAILSGYRWSRVGQTVMDVLRDYDRSDTTRLYGASRPRNAALAVAVQGTVSATMKTLISQLGTEYTVTVYASGQSIQALIDEPVSLVCLMGGALPEEGALPVVSLVSDLRDVAGLAIDGHVVVITGKVDFNAVPEVAALEQAFSVWWLDGDNVRAARVENGRLVCDPDSGPPERFIHMLRREAERFSRGDPVQLANDFVRILKNYRLGPVAGWKMKRRLADAAAKPVHGLISAKKMS